jgi:Flp pilus assembly protein TadD
MQPISRICGRLLPALSVALTLSACASSAQQAPVVSADAILRVADMTRGEGDLASAAGLYQKAHELNPTDPHALIMLGQTLAKLGSASGAAEAYRAALQLDGTNAEALRGLGTAFLNVGQPDAAIAQYEKALDAGEDYRLYNGIAVAYDMLGDHASAQTYYRTALQLSPGNLELNNNLALSLALEGRYKEAIPLLEQATADPMATPRYRQNLAFVYGLAGERDRARQLAEHDLDAATVERNMTYFEVLKGLGDDRTMASALGAHYADQTLPNVPVAALPQTNSAPVVPAPEPDSMSAAPVNQGELAPSPTPTGATAAPKAVEATVTTEPVTTPADSETSQPQTEIGESSAPLALVGDTGRPVVAGRSPAVIPDETDTDQARTEDPIRSNSPARVNSEFR